MNVFRLSVIAMAIALGSSAIAQETGSVPFEDELEKMAAQSEIQLKSELVMIEVAIKSIETAKDLNDYAGGLDRLNVWFAVPTVLLAGTEIAIQGARLSDGLIRVMTPEKARWFNEYSELKAAVKNAEKAYRKASRLGDASAQDLHIRLLQAENALTSKLLQRPGKLYKFGRLLRAVGRSSVLLAGVAVTAMSFNEAILIGVGRDQMQNLLQKFKTRKIEIELLLDYKAQNAVPPPQ